VSHFSPLITSEWFCALTQSLLCIYLSPCLRSGVVSATVYESQDGRSMIGKCTVIYRLTPPPPPKLSSSQRSKSVSTLTGGVRSKRNSLRAQKRSQTEAVLPSGSASSSTESPRTGGVAFDRSHSDDETNSSKNDKKASFTAGDKQSRARARPTSVMVGNWEDTESSIPLRAGTTRVPNRRKTTSLKRPSSLKNIFSIASRSSSSANNSAATTGNLGKEDKDKDKDKANVSTKHVDKSANTSSPRTTD